MIQSDGDSLRVDGNSQVAGLAVIGLIRRALYDRRLVTDYRVSQNGESVVAELQYDHTNEWISIQVPPASHETRDENLDWDLIADEVRDMIEHVFISPPDVQSRLDTNDIKQR